MRGTERERVGNAVAISRKFAWGTQETQRRGGWAFAVAAAIPEG
jgi:hypothetical protein